MHHLAVSLVVVALIGHNFQDIGVADRIKLILRGVKDIDVLVPIVILLRTKVTPVRRMVLADIGNDFS
jgi:hypothetical protein